MTPLVDSRGQVAQLVEQRTENPCVAGSIPALAILQFVVETGDTKSATTLLGGRFS
jgi:hypothetical protein